MLGFKTILGHLKRFFIGGTSCCCCLPVRFGVIAMSLLTVLVAGSLSIILWYQYSVADALDPGEIRTLIGLALLETLLMVASVFGFIGSVVRKQLFVMIYGYFLYAHFAVNLAVAIYFLVIVGDVKDTAVMKACQDTIQDADAKGQCIGILDTVQHAIIGISVLILLIELYNALVSARYIRQLRNQKRTRKESRLALRQSKLDSFRQNKLSAVGGDSEPSPPLDQAFDPYRDVQGLPADSTPKEGYGGGTWTHAEIAEEVKERVPEDEYEMPQGTKSSYAPVKRHESISSPPKYNDA